ncbi:Nodule Cysteine-Rich (NCR) secreted peptide [Medicago truncatula]|uniref:Nodule Cysteine-Rich (NCR) secreted peptide n=2 Tax=Medicago truncatula TaxID=3880 RepID=I3SVG9_MEDTR|nr:unknown [Medicago truncatula]KEH22755.1 Nodule Cysteine-Rich (NCR) secreted peptide [Medicago truncatula]
MAKTLNYVYVLILFISIFLSITVYGYIPGIVNKPCKTDKDCPKKPPHNIRCRKGQCVEIL